MPTAARFLMGWNGPMAPASEQGWPRDLVSKHLSGQSADQRTFCKAGR